MPSFGECGVSLVASARRRDAWSQGSMAALLARWINTDVRLGVKVSNLDADFGTGYLFAELLVALGYLEDSSEFSRRQSTSVRTTNFKRLAPVLREALGITLTDKMVRDIVTEQRGSAARLLYKIKTVHDVRTGAPGALVAPSKPSDSASVGSGTHGKKWVRPTAGEADVVAAVAANPALPYNQKVMTLHTHKFVEERLAQDAAARTLEAQEIAQLRAEAAERHEKQRGEVKEKADCMVSLRDEREKNWRATQRVKQVRSRQWAPHHGVLVLTRVGACVWLLWHPRIASAPSCGSS